MDKYIKRLNEVGEALVLNSLTELSRKDELSMGCFYFLYSIAKDVDGIKGGAEFYDALQSYHHKFGHGKIAVLLDYLKQLDKESDAFKLGRMLGSIEGTNELGTIFFNNKNRTELIAVFDRELF